MLRLIEDACRRGDVITIVYRGGSQPGTKRTIRPRVVDGHLLQAIDITTHLPKSFRIDLLDVVDHDADFPVYRPDAISTLHDVEAACAERMADLGWHVVLTDARLALHGSTKAGHVSRRASIHLSNTGGSKPWTVKSPYRFKRSFDSLERASRFLVAEAARHRETSNVDVPQGRVVKGRLDWGGHVPQTGGFWSRLSRWLGIWR